MTQTTTPADDQSATIGPPNLLTMQQAADLLQVGRCTMQELVLTGAIASIKIGRLRRIPLESLDGYVARLLAEGGNAA